MFVGVVLLCRCIIVLASSGCEVLCLCCVRVSKCATSSTEGALAFVKLSNTSVALELFDIDLCLKIFLSMSLFDFPG